MFVLRDSSSFPDDQRFFGTGRILPGPSEKQSISKSKMHGAECEMRGMSSRKSFTLLFSSIGGGLPHASSNYSNIYLPSFAVES
jgi:hypothetical protein